MDIGQRFCRRMSLKGMGFELETNYRAIIEDDEYFMSKGAHLHSLLSNFHKLEEIAVGDEAVEFRVVVEHIPGMKHLEFSRPEPGDGNGEVPEYRFTGPIRELEEGAKDKRASIFGNMGIFSKILVHELEERGIFSFHSTSFLVPGSNRLILVLGGSGAGKSTVALRSVIEKLEMFGTELTHIRFIDGKVEFLKGSLWQNCKMGNIVEDFPQLLETFGITDVPEGNPWKQYKSIDMRPWSHAADAVFDPEVTVLFPRIEQERSVPERYELSPEATAYSLYENLADKVSPPSNVYKKFFIPSIDRGSDQVRRMEAARQFVKEVRTNGFRKILTNPNECLETIV